ncbi:hypothetical protein BDP81DRAFT_473543 [Colletotrichum phormii]|uniref:DUF7357 domain-containing protein n=1 Tax=Colletotrichum phormii TaxID=359342 RepID=A0AAI9ZNN0_9PEZI|nr:uncharacterized protein BDP81DRAFT_473543 [Colletotrichum phormii]KAK1633962.1 hypothetical protein BDP81DRAFT_473543 [Colletotrichum phormii]
MEKDLRLRLVVRRHGVPDVKLLWNVTANEDLTISKLLTQVNDVVPLEGGEWGLEDYAVELKDASGDGFECVHYHLVSKVLKDDDQVLIRPLLTGDLKRRRLSGRHQISADGKHLVDGLAFGRPWLRAPRDRPTVALPPRKKARITYTSEDEEDSPSEAEVQRPMLEYESTRAQEDSSSVQLRTRFYDADLGGDSEEEEDDFEPAAAHDDDDEGMDSENDDIQDELRMLREDNAAVREGDILEELRNIRDRRTSSGTASSSRSLETSDDSPVPSASNALVRSGGRSNRFQLNLDTLDKIAALRAAFPSARVSTIERTLLRYSANSARAYRKLDKTFEPRLSLQQTLDHQARSLSSSPIRHANSNTGRELVLRESSLLERSSHATSHDQDEEDEDVDENDSDEASETLNHNAHADHASIGSNDVSDSDSESSSEGATSGSDEDMGNTSDNDSVASSSENESDDESSEVEGGGPVMDEDDSDSADEKVSSSDDDSSSDGSSSDESSVASAKERLSARQAAIVEVSSDSSSDSDSSSEDSSSDSEPEELPSKTLSSQRILFDTVKPNETLKLPKAAPGAAAQPKQEQPDVPPGQGLSKTQKRNARRKLAKKMAVQTRSPSAANSAELSPAGMSEELAAFQARKQALLNALASDGPAETSQEKPLEIPDSAPQDAAASTADADIDMMETSQSPSAQGAASERRMKPNVGAARRMLMGSLGLKNPKNKADEDKIRQDLMKGVRPHTNARLSEGASQPSESAQTQELVEEDSEAWREKIAYRAVECCHDGVELSEPPFPFVQRWDPQQRVEEWFGSKNKRGGKRKRVQRDQAQYHEGGDSQSSKKRRVTDESFGVAFSDAVESAQEGDTTLNYDDPSDDPPVTKKPAEESQATDIDDLPSLPSDLSTLQDLRPGEAKLGMVITWKQLALSSQTNWQPQVVSLTGVLVRIYDEDASDLEFILAHRDRGVDRTEKTYDEETGERVYDRFEAPDDDEDEEAENEVEEGHRRVNYLELIEPKIVQLPLDDDTKAGGNEKLSASEGESDPTDSVIHETIYDGQSQPSQLNGEISGQSEVGEVGSQSKVDAKGSRARANTDTQQPQGVAGSNPRLDASADGDESSHPGVHLEGDDHNMDESDMPTPRAKDQLKDDNNTVPTTEDDSQNSNGNALSISSDRRHEISIMIEEAGFRKDVSPSVIRRKTSSPSRQLLDQLEAADTPRVISKSPLSQESLVNVTPAPDNSRDAGTGVTDDGSVPPPSSMSSIRSGRQVDPDDFGFNMGDDDVQQMSDNGHGSPSVDASTPRPQVHTPTREKDTPEPNSGEKSSLPSLESLFKTASQRNSQKNTQSPSKSQSTKPQMRQIDEADEDEENEEEDDETPRKFGKTRKTLFPNSSQPDSESPDLPDLKPTAKSAPSSFIETEDVQPRLLRERVRTGSPFVVPPGSQVVTLSSSPPSSPLEENYAEDDVDEDYEENNSSSLPHGSGWVQKNKPPKANPRAKSVPAARPTAKTATTGRPVSSSSMPARPAAKGKGPCKSSARF